MLDEQAFGDFELDLAGIGLFLPGDRAQTRGETGGPELDRRKVDGHPHVIETMVDITEQKRAEQHRLELTVERERVNILRQVISDMSHDLKNPMNQIRLAQFLLRELGMPFAR